MKAGDVQSALVSVGTPDSPVGLTGTLLGFEHRGQVGVVGWYDEEVAQTQLQQVMESLLRGNETEVCIIGDHDPPLIITPKPRAPKTFGPEEIRALTTKLLTATNEIQASSIRITQFAMRFGETQENHLAHFAAALPELAATVAPGLQEVVIDLGSGEAFARADELLRGLLPPT